MKMRIALILILTTAFVLGSCSLFQKKDSAIRTVDFENFTYDWTDDLKGPSNSFTLRNGEHPATRDRRGMIDGMGVIFGGVKYGDVTCDGVEEAIVVVSIQTGGSAVPGIVYIYTWEKNAPKLLWSRDTGDRADDGYRNAYAEGGDFILALNSPMDKQGDCCPTKFVRTRYKWTGNEFQQMEEQTLPVG